MYFFKKKKIKLFKFGVIVLVYIFIWFYIELVNYLWGLDLWLCVRLDGLELKF